VDTEKARSQFEKRKQGLPNGQMAFAFVMGEAITEAPSDLYIPPDALEILIEAFEGPFDLLLYLIKRQNLDILLVNVAEITDQYMAYVELMEASQFELAAEYLVMASMLAEIKSRILLPRQEELNEEESDPRLDLLKRLQEYEKFKIAAEGLDKLPRIERDLYPTKAAMPVIEKITVEPEVDLHEMLSILSKALRRADMFESHQIQRDTLSTREKMSEILLRINSENFVPLFSLLSQDEGRLGVVVTFLAIMELLKDSMIEIVQSGPYAAIHVKQC